MKNRPHEWSVGRTPWSAADAPVGLCEPTQVSGTGARSRPGGRLQTRGSAPLTRRSLLAGLSALAFASPGANKIRLGGPVFLKSDDPRELAREHRRLGYSAALCPRAKADDSARVRDIEQAFAAENVVIAEVGA